MALDAHVDNSLFLCYLCTVCNTFIVVVIAPSNDSTFPQISEWELGKCCQMVPGLVTLFLGRLRDVSSCGEADALRDWIRAREN